MLHNKEQLQRSLKLKNFQFKIIYIKSSLKQWVRRRRTFCVISTATFFHSYAFAFFHCSSFAQQFRRLFNALCISANCVKHEARLFNRIMSPESPITQPFHPSTCFSFDSGVKCNFLNRMREYQSEIGDRAAVISVSCWWRWKQEEKETHGWIFQTKEVCAIWTSSRLTVCIFHLFSPRFFMEMLSWNKEKSRALPRLPRKDLDLMLASPSQSSLCNVLTLFLLCFIAFTRIFSSLL